MTKLSFGAHPFLLGFEQLERLVERWWPEAIGPADMANAELWRDVKAARAALLAEVGLAL